LVDWLWCNCTCCNSLQGFRTKRMMEKALQELWPFMTNMLWQWNNSSLNRSVYDVFWSEDGLMTKIKRASLSSSQTNPVQDLWRMLYNLVTKQFVINWINKFMTLLVCHNPITGPTSTLISVVWPNIYDSLNLNFEVRNDRFEGNSKYRSCSKCYYLQHSNIKFYSVLLRKWFKFKFTYWCLVLTEFLVCL